MGKCLEWWAPPVFWNFTPEQVQNPEKLVEYLEKVCCHPGNSRDTQITAMCWGLAHAYRALFNTIQYLQREEKVSGSDDKRTGTVATRTPATGTAAEPKDTPVLVSVAPIQKKKYIKKPIRLVRDDDEPGSSREQEEEAEPEVIT
ncbi:microtubule-associated protein RP/EB family member 1-like [Grus japonensis]|uniref:Microtubule-associated protein RP/EB family member 1-like n=1 Tax=Grus japonensis TaxID=30415 RepID=A0ABC9YFA0_GRUJA